jgi:hypothetical protein
MCVCNSNITSFSLHVSLTKEIRETFKENEVILLLHTHMTKVIKETFKENEVTFAQTQD